MAGNPLVADRVDDDHLWYDSVVVFGGYAAGTALLTVGFMAVPGLALVAVVTGMKMVWATLRLLWRRPRLRVTSEGVVDENFWYSSGLLPWSIIRDIRPTKWGLIQIELLDEDAHYELLHPLKRLALLKMRILGLPLGLLMPWGLRGSRGEIVSQLKDGLNRWVVEEAARGEPAGPTREVD